MATTRRFYEICNELKNMRFSGMAEAVEEASGGEIWYEITLVIDEETYTGYSTSSYIAKYD